MAELEAGLGPHRLVVASRRPGGNSPLGEPEPLLAEADLAFGQPEAEQVAAAPRLRWVHLSSAGYTTFDRPTIRAAISARGARLTSSSSVYDEPCAQHALAFMLAGARQIPRSVRQQAGARAWTTADTRAASYLLKDQTVVLVGFGAIARRLSELLAPFGLEVIGARRAPRGDEPVAMVPIDEVEAVLARADHVVDILPASAETTRFFSRDRLRAIRRGAVFYNIGRGITVDQEALAEALGDGHLRAAYLDVTDPEPLPADHPLWSMDNCTITPHSAGGHENEDQRLVRHFLANLRRFEAGERLADVVV